MEAVPRLPMLSFQLKVSPEATSFAKLKQYIRDFYNEDPESYTNEIHQLEQLRGMAVRPPIAITGCSILKKYYCQLHFVQSRFPMATDEVAAVPFSWRDTYANMVFTLSNIRFEIISVLYNIGAIHSQLGGKTERTSADGMKMACSHFQCAAWAFEHLQNSYPQAPGVDMSPELMKFMHQLCLAQAQECILEKSMLDNRKPTIVAKVAKQIIDYYSLAMRTLESNNSEDSPIADSVGSKIHKTWKNYVKFKKLYYTAVTYLYQGLASEEQQKMGERVAFYNAALGALNSARSLHASVKGTGGITGVSAEKDAIEDALVFTNDVIEGKRKAAKNENEFIYHEEVPEKDMLPTVNGASLVKGIPFNVNDPEISGPDIFARLVPMKVHEASSLYSEEKAKILRAVGGKIGEKDQVLETYLSSLKLQHLSLWDPDVSSPEEYLPIPEELVERCAALNAKPTAIKDLEDMISKLSTTYGDVENMLKEIDKYLKEEEQKEKSYQETVGKRPPSIVATDLTREAKKYEEAHAKASESNQALHRAMNLHLDNLQILSQPLNEVLSRIPAIKRADGNNSSPSEMDKQNIKELKRILAKVEEMQKQRGELHAKLRDSIAQDNLTRILVTATAESVNLDALFSEHLEKHKSLVDLIDKNLAAQDNILTALTDAYARTAETRKAVDEVVKRRDMMISSLIGSYDAYEDLMAKASKGLEFYRKLEVNVTKLLQRVKSTCRVQEEEREQIIAKNEKTTTYDPNDENVISISVGEKKSGSGMKLRDHLNRMKNNAAGNYYHYSEKSQVPVVPVQPNTAQQASEMMKQYQDQGYQGYYYPNQGYYPQVNSPYAQYPVGYDTSFAQNGGTSQSLPRSLTTNSDNQYRQAGTTPTEVASETSLYAGYQNFKPENQVQPTAQIPQAYPNPQSAKGNNYSYSDYSQPKNTSNYQGYYQAVPATTSIDHKPVNTVNPMSQSPSHVMQNARPEVSGPPQAQIPPVQAQMAPQAHVPPMQAQIPPQVQVPPARTQMAPQGPSVQAQVTPQVQSHIPNQAQVTPVQPQAQVKPAQVQPPSAQIQMPKTYVYPSAVSQAGTYDQGYPVVSTPGSGQYPGVVSGTPDPTQMQMYYKQMTPAHQVPTTQQDTAYASYGQPYNQANQASSSVPVNYSKPTDTIIQSHAKSSSQYLSKQGYQYSMYPNYSQGYPGTNSWQGQPDSYQNHPGYSYDSATGVYQYSSGYQQISGQITVTGPTNNSPANNSHYTSANNAAVTSSTPSGFPNGNYNGKDYYSQYSNQMPQGTQGAQTAPNQPQYQVQNNQAPQMSQTGMNNQTVLNQSQYQVPNAQNINVINQTPQNVSTGNQAPYAAQVSNQAHVHNQVPLPQNVNVINQNPQSVPANNQVPYVNQMATPNQTGVPNQTQHSITINNQIPQNAVPNQGYIQPTPEPKSTPPQSAKKSNLDLLADLDITINHAPLVPEVQTEPSKPVAEEKSEEKEPEPELQVKEDRPFDEKLENLQIVWDTWYNDVQPKRDPLGDPVVLQKFITDLERYEKFVDGLIVKTLSGSTNLEIKWKEIRDFEEREAKKQGFSAAQAHSAENRSADWVPYDSTRVKLESGLDYINASHVKDLTQWTPMFIITQAPKQETTEAFWSMIWEQGSEVIACLCTDEQLNSQQYWPSQDSHLAIGKFSLQCKSLTNHSSYIRRLITIFNSKDKMEKTVVHMQYISWPQNTFPSSPGSFLSFATDIMSEQALRHCPKPIVVHCMYGGPLSGIFVLAAAAVCHVRAGHGIIDVPLVLSTLAKYRKCLIDRESLLFGYRMVLYHAQDSLMKRGILSSTRSTFDGFDSLKGKGKTVKHCHPSDDFLHNLGVGGIPTARQPANDLQSTTKTTSDSEDNKTDRVKPVDPLSQLDPLWSIRK